MSKNKETKYKSVLPYGKYIFADGSQVLFNRKYEILTPYKVKDLELSKLKSRIPEAKEVWFYTDANPPWIDKETLEKCKSLLKAFDVE
ncbi:MAG: hypothetical protein LPK26_17450 [Bacillaceae bacterium]|nr:hypothetical protein [Bacillaceae bacterium]